jgi:hypothetical protein
MRWKMKKYILALMLLFTVTTPVFALGIVDAMTCRKVVLQHADRTVLVKRMTGEVKYLLLPDGHWSVVKGSQKRKYQAMYDAESYKPKR